MRIDIITVLPELIQGFMQESIVGRAQKKGLAKCLDTALSPDEVRFMEEVVRDIQVEVLDK